jgi:hypothetical protein
MKYLADRDIAPPGQRPLQKGRSAGFSKFATDQGYEIQFESDFGSSRHLK